MPIGQSRGPSTDITRLLAFLIWNALVHFARTAAATSWAYALAMWRATRERYELVVLDMSLPGMMPQTRIKNALIGDLFGIAIIILFVSNLIGPVANFTTGITIAHTGFTPNPNVTGSVGLVPLVQLIPFIFVAVLIFGVFNVLERHIPHGL